MVDLLMKTLRGWEVEVVDGDGLTEKCAKNGELRCIDGRNPKLNWKEKISRHYQRGAAWPGALVGVAVMKYGYEEKAETALALASTDCESLGLTAGIHGDEEDGELGCGFFGKLRSGALVEHFPGWQRWSRLSSVEMVVKKNNGVYRELQGGHEETRLIINLRADETTRLDGRSFIFDLWLAEKLGIDARFALEVTADTIKLLKPEVNHAIILT